MAVEEKPVQEFLEAVRRSPDLWHSLDLRVLAVRVAGEWHNILTRCYLSSRTPQRIVTLPNLPNTEEVWCSQHVLPLGDLEKVIKGVEEGELRLGSGRVLYRAIRAAAGHDKYHVSGYTFSDLSERFRASFRPWSSHQLTAMGNSVHELFIEVPGRRVRLDNAVRTLASPFDGLEGLARYAVGSPDALEPNRNCLFELFAPLEALIQDEQCHFERGVLHYALRAGSKAAAQASRLGVFARGPGPAPYADTVAIRPKQWKESGGYWETEGELELPDHRVATLLLSVGAYAAHRVTLFDVGVKGGNPRLDAFRTFDRAFEVLRDSLASQGSQGAAQFDSAVARVLGLAGFQVIRLSGDKRLEEGVDLVAHVPGGSVCLAIECTTGPLDSNGKLGKLVARAEGLRRDCPSLDVQAVIMTTLDAAQVLQTDRDTASDERVAVLCREDLEELVALVLGGGELSEVLSWMRTRVPRKPPKSPPFAGRRWP